MLQNHLKSKKLILASESPRRQELLKHLRVPFEIRNKPVEEIYAETLQGEEITDFLAQLKASVFKADL
ncbi:MAG: Maf family protein, partial [Bacteroidota bacterium]|nr:Maf family protein [Bacteroidota bacterium]